MCDEQWAELDGAPGLTMLCGHYRALDLLPAKFHVKEIIFL